MTIVVSELEGTLTTGASWRGIRAYFWEFRSLWTYDCFLLGWLPRYLLVKAGLLNRKKAMGAWMKADVNKGNLSSLNSPGGAPYPVLENNHRRRVSSLTPKGCKTI
jgi:hypothetical protein